MRANLQLANEAQWKRLARRCWKPVKHVPEQPRDISQVKLSQQPTFNSKCRP